MVSRSCRQDYKAAIAMDIYGKACAMKTLYAVTVGLVLSCPAWAQSPIIVAPDGQYLGNLNSNTFDPNSVSNPYGQYGSPHAPNSINNPYGQYGSPYSPNSVNNPYAVQQRSPVVVRPQRN